MSCARTVRLSYAPAAMHPRFRRRSALIAFAAAGVTLAAGCASPPKPVITSVSLTLAATPDVNPDAQGRASPVVARFYVLKAPGAFESADFFSLQDKDSVTLGGDLVQREEVILRPGEQRSFQLELAPDVKALGFVGAYRDLAHARWRQSEPLTPGRKIALTATYGARGIVLEGR